MIRSLVFIALFSFFNFYYAQFRQTTNPIEIRTTKGKFFIHTLHSGNFFPQAGCISRNLFFDLLNPDLKVLL